MNEEKRINYPEDAEQVRGGHSTRADKPLSSKQLFRIAAELQELLTKRRSQNRRFAASANLTHYVE
jgi:hypothetical protein